MNFATFIHICTGCFNCSVSHIQSAVISTPLIGQHIFSFKFQKHSGVNEISFQVIEMEMKRNAVIALHLKGKKTYIQTRRALSKIQLNKNFVQFTIKRFKETGSIEKRYCGGRQCTAMLANKRQLDAPTQKSWCAV